jgi:hypothetical protein
MVTVTASVMLVNEMVPAISSSGVANVTHFKNCQVPLMHLAQPLLSLQSYREMKRSTRNIQRTECCDIPNHAAFSLLIC